MHGIYHPPYSLTNKVTNSKSIKEFTDYVSTCLPEHPNNIFIGDFNLYVSDELDMDATIFNDSIDALGLYQHVGFVMHKSGNVLDLILSDLTNSTMVLTTALGPYVTNHRAVIGTLSIKKLRPKQLTAMVRQTSKVSDQQWNDEFNPDNVDLTSKLDTLVSSFNTELRRVYDTLAPQKEIKVNTRPKQPWYDREIKTLKRKVHKYEKKWLKYKMNSLWTAYKKVRNSYFGTLNAKKKAVLQGKIHNCTKDSRKLHTLVNNLTTKHTEEEWPEHTSNDELAEGFASYFQGKIEKIRDLLKNKPKYNPTQMDVPELKRFAPLTENQVSKVITSLKSKSCELDAIPTVILKKILPKVITLITKIVNISLGDGLFCREWKTAVVRPLLKKLGLEIIFSNFRPLSNLTFISKVIK